MNTKANVQLRMSRDEFESAFLPGKADLYSFVRRDAEGFFTFVGRRDQLIKTQGYRVSPDEVALTERVSRLHPHAVDDLRTLVRIPSVSSDVSNATALRHWCTSASRCRSYPVSRF